MKKVSYWGGEAGGWGGFREGYGMRRRGAYQRVEDQHAVGFSEDPDDEGEEAGEKRHETGHVDATDVVAEVADGRTADGLAQIDWCAPSALGAQETQFIVGSRDDCAEGKCVALCTYTARK